MYVAASGHEWTDNEMRGVYKTTNGGKSWDRIYYKSPRTGANDLVMDPRNPNVLYASLWQRIRRKWSDPRVEPGYNEGGVIKTTDGGKTWADASQGLPQPEHRGRIGIDLARSKPDTLYAMVDNYEIGRMPRPSENDAYGRPMPQGKGFIKGADVYRSDDGGKSWRQTSRYDEATTNRLNNNSGTYGWVFGQIRVDPTTEDTIWIMGVPLSKSTDGGKTFTTVGGMHGDHHGLWIDPANTNIIYNANDGGFYQTADGGKTWRFAVAAAGAQFYNIELDTSTPFWAYGSIQDHGSYRAQVDLGRGRDALSPVAFSGAPGGEGSHHAVDPNNPNIVYSHGFYGSFSRTDLTPPPADAAPAPAGRGRGRGGVATPIRPTDPDAELRAQWMAPFIISPHDNSIVYAGYQFVFRSRTRGDSWEKISPDLTDNNRAQMGENPSAIPYQSIVAIAESPRKKDLLYIGHGRWTAAFDARRREGMDRSHDAAAGAPLDLAAGAVDARRYDRLRHAARPRRRRLRRLRLQVHRQWTHVPVDHEQHSGRPGERDSRGSAESERALRGHRLRRLRLDQRRRPMEGARRQSAVGAGLGPGVPAARQHAGHLDVRARHLGDGRRIGEIAPCRLPTIRSGTRTPSSIRCTSAASSTATTTARRLLGPDPAARLHPVARRQHALASAVLPVAAAR